MVHAAVQAVEAWLRAEGERVTMYVVSRLTVEVERMKKGKPLTFIRGYEHESIWPQLG